LFSDEKFGLCKLHAGEQNSPKTCTRSVNCIKVTEDILEKRDAVECAHFMHSALVTQVRKAGIARMLYGKYLLSLGQAVGADPILPTTCNPSHARCKDREEFSSLGLTFCALILVISTQQRGVEEGQARQK
jgi:hypothetical protein